MRKTLPFAFIAVLLGFVFVAFQFYTGPQRSMLNTAQAITNKDPGKLNKSVDFPVLRENIKSQMRELMIVEAENDLEMAGMMLGMGLADGFIEQMITAEGIIGLVHMGMTDRENNDIEKLKKNIEDNVQVKFLNLSNAKIIVSDEEHFAEGTMKLFFERRGLSWVLINIELPEGL